MQSSLFYLKIGEGLLKTERVNDVSEHSLREGRALSGFVSGAFSVGSEERAVPWSTGTVCRTWEVP